MDNWTKETKKIRKLKTEKLFNTETMIPISEIRWDTLILKDWWLRAILKVNWLNFDLKSYQEIQFAIENYKRFLNWLNFPLHLYVRSTYLDLSDYIVYMKEKVNKLENKVLKFQWDKYVSFIEDINLKQWLIFSKEFYIIVPYYTSEHDVENVRKPWWRQFLDVLDSKDSAEKIVFKYRNFIKDKKFLDTRCNIIIEWLRAFWMMVQKLDILEIISLFFKVYNPKSDKSQSTLPKNK